MRQKEQAQSDAARAQAAKAQADSDAAKARADALPSAELPPRKLKRIWPPARLLQPMQFRRRRPMRNSPA